jgi:hypothetical protein
MFARLSHPTNRADEGGQTFQVIQPVHLKRLKWKSCGRLQSRRNSGVQSEQLLFPENSSSRRVTITRLLWSQERSIHRTDMLLLSRFGWRLRATEYCCWITNAPSHSPPEMWSGCGWRLARLPQRQRCAVCLFVSHCASGELPRSICQGMEQERIGGGTDCGTQSSVESCPRPSRTAGAFSTLLESTKSPSRRAIVSRAADDVRKSTRCRCRIRSSLVCRDRVLQPKNRRRWIGRHMLNIRRVDWSSRSCHVLR